MVRSSWPKENFRCCSTATLCATRMFAMFAMFARKCGQVDRGSLVRRSTSARIRIRLPVFRSAQSRLARIPSGRSHHAIPRSNENRFEGWRGGFCTIDANIHSWQMSTKPRNSAWETPWAQFHNGRGIIFRLRADRGRGLNARAVLLPRNTWEKEEDGKSGLTGPLRC